MIPRPPRSTLFPYTTLFRSLRRHRRHLVTQTQIQGQVGTPTPVVLNIHAEQRLAKITWGERAGDSADRKSTRLNSSHVEISYAVFCLKKKKVNNSIYI